MKKDWIVKEWIKNKLGITNHHRERYEEMGRAIAEGLAEGIKSTESVAKTGKLFGEGMVKEFTKGMEEGKLDELTTAMLNQQIAFAEVGLKAKSKHDEPVDKSDTFENVHDVHIHDGKLVHPRNNHTIIDPLIESFTDSVWAQQEKVLAIGKYEHPIHKDNHTAMEWMDHQMSEFADALVYRECLKQTIQDVAHLIEQAREFNRDQQNHNGYIVHSILNDALKRLGTGI